MTDLRVRRSATGQFLLGLAGLLLVLTAIDLLWAMVLSEPPETNDEGVMTTRGHSQRRADLVWGSVFLVTGSGITLLALGGLLNEQDVVRLDESGITLRIAGPTRNLTIRWDQVLDVRSTRLEGDGQATRDALVIEVADARHFPTELWGAEWVGATLQVDADSWSVPPDEVAVRAQLALMRARRSSAADTETAT